MIGQNVANFIVMPIVGPAAAATVLTLKTEPVAVDVPVSNMLTVKVDADIENTSNLVVQPQDSADGVTYANVGSAITVVPGGARVSGAQFRQYIRFQASGNAHGRLILSTDARTQHLSQLP